LGEARIDYEAYLDYGHRLVAGADYPSFRAKVNELAQSDATQSWIALLALCHSIFVSGDAARRGKRVDLDPLVP
jgi:L-rhamnose mutarotase